MKLVSITNKTKSDEIVITKAVGSLAFATSCAHADLLNEKITVTVERANGSNEILMNKVSLKDFVIHCSFGSEAIQSSSAFPMIALCDLTPNGSIYLAEKELLKVQLDDLRTTITYDVYGIEEPIFTNEVYSYELKTVASEDVTKKLDVRGFDLAVITNSSTISDISYTYDNGQVVKYTPFELNFLATDIDPLMAVKSDGTVVQNLSDRIALPLFGVNIIEVNKSQGTVINLLVRQTKEI